MVLFSLLCLLMLNSSVIMCLALFKIKKAIGNYIKNRAKNKQMINHALAFILYMGSYALGKLLDFADEDTYYYIDWIPIALAGFISEACLAYLLWSLGTKHKQVIYLA